MIVVFLYKCPLCVAVTLERKAYHDLEFDADILVGQSRKGEIILSTKTLPDDAHGSSQQLLYLYKYILENGRFRKVWTELLPRHQIDAKCRKHVCDDGHLLFQNEKDKATYYCVRRQEESESVPAESRIPLIVTHKYDQVGEFVACLPGNRCVYKYKSGPDGAGIRSIRVVCIDLQVH